MFARSQTTVCLDANKCLPTGKYSKTASIVPQNMLLGSSLDALFPLNSPSFLYQQPKKTSESLCSSDFLYYLCPVVPDMGDALGRRPRGRHTHWGKLMQTTMMPFPKLLK
jgi:hypothetical protein